MKEKTWAVCTELCFVCSDLNSRILLLSWTFIFWKPLSMMGNDKLQKENQTLRNEVKELKNKLQKVSDDLSKSQVGW